MKVFLDTNVWLSATVFAGLCEAILIECHQRDWLLTTKLVQSEAHEVFVTGDKRVLTWGREANMQILSPRDAWMQLFAGNDGA